MDLWRLNLKLVYEENELIKNGLYISMILYFR